MDAIRTLNDPTELVRQLDARLIRERIDALDRERQALMVLLRAALRARSGEGGAHER